jgi:hypothetical protein
MAKCSNCGHDSHCGEVLRRRRYRTDPDVDINDEGDWPGAPHLGVEEGTEYEACNKCFCEECKYAIQQYEA